MFQAAAEIGLRGGPEEKDDSEEDDLDEDGDEDEEQEEDSKESEMAVKMEELGFDSGEPAETVDTNPIMESADNQEDTEKPAESSSSQMMGDMDSVQPSTSQTALRRDRADSEDDEIEEDLSQANRDMRPFRDQASRDHINAHLMKELRGRARNTDSTCSSASTATIDPQLVKQKVKRQMKQKQAKQFAHRIRKSGEASIATQRRREYTDDIKQSVSAEWY